MSSPLPNRSRLELAMKDLVLVGPILMVGGIFVVSTQSGNWHGPGSHFTLELAFLTFLFSLLFAWHRGKQAAAERLRAMELGWRQPERLGSLTDRPEHGDRRDHDAVGPVRHRLAGKLVPPRPLNPDLERASLLGMTILICGTILLLRATFLVVGPLRASE